MKIFSDCTQYAVIKKLFSVIMIIFTTTYTKVIHKAHNSGVPGEIFSALRG
ncbi:hypothetical protein ACFP3I_15535 [Chryseobacterium arachidis]|uniref:hypothetical protein n=1 Tax=Chryseobacterium arachidis TaxID=1416778 RepID=UPI0036225794